MNQNEDAHGALPGRTARLEWMSRMVDVYENELTDAEREELAIWEELHVTGESESATSDWPGWQKHIGPPPWKVELN